MKKNLWSKQIPTLLGIGVLVIALVVGVFMFGQGTGVFAPRAAPETTPQKIQVTNVSDTGFTVSFFTQEKTAGFVKYGTEQGNLRNQASDDRDQLSGAVGTYNLHHVTVRGLSPNTSYYYVLGTGSRNTFDNSGSPFTIKTAQRGGTPTAAQTAYGNVTNAQGSPADGAVVYLTIDGVGPMSSLVKSSGSWAVPLSNARKTDGSGYAELTDSTPIGITVQGTSANETTTANATVGSSQPVENISLGGGGDTTADTTRSTTSPSPTTETTPAATPPLTGTDEAAQLTSSDTQAQQANPGALGGLVESQTLSSPSSTSSATTQSTVDIDAVTVETVVGQPKIVGKAAPNVTVTLEVNSETQITQEVQTDANGNFELDLETLGANLEPGEHTVTATYTDPETGQTVTKTQTFTVGENNTVQLAQASTTTTNQPYSSSSPVPIGGTSQTSTQSATATESATASDSASKGGVGTESGRASQPATTSALPKSGAVGTTLALVIGGLFFIISGVWSFWIAQQLDEARIEA